MSWTAVIVGGGSGTRFGGDKVFADLGGVPVLAHTVAAFEACAAVSAIVLVLRPDAMAAGRALGTAQGWRKLVAVVPGGARRQDSVLAGVTAAATDFVLIHDAARPLVDTATLDRALASLDHTNGAIAAVPVRDTIKRVGPGERIVETVDRSTLWAAQTPQAFRRDVLITALLASEDVTDDAAALEAIGEHVHVFLGAASNIKITTREDLAVADALLRARA